jgi:tetratricopeptide (TPR) repeat protein
MMYGMDFDERLSSETRFEASYVLELHDWKEAASLAPLKGVDPDYNSEIYLARALGAARSGQVDEARKDVEEVKSIAKFARDKKRPEEANFLERQINEPLAWIAHDEGKDDEAIKMLRAIAEKEKDGFSGTGFLPAQELIGDLLMDAKRPQEALVEYQTDLKVNPIRFDSLYGAAQAAAQAGKQKEASDYYAQLLKSCEGGSSTRAELTRAKELLAKK